MTSVRDDNTELSRRQEVALSTLLHALARDKIFPQSPFLGSWARFRFFSSDWIFAADFADRVKGLLRLEGAACACIADLDSGPDAAHPDSFYFDRLTTPTEYMERLNRASPEFGWTTLMSRFGITSDIGSWLVYCQKATELAVIGFKVGVAPDTVDAMARQLDAFPLETAIEKPVAYIFWRGAPKKWLETLIAAYPSEPGPPEP